MQNVGQRAFPCWDIIVYVYFVKIPLTILIHCLFSQYDTIQGMIFFKITTILNEAGGNVRNWPYNVGRLFIWVEKEARNEERDEHFEIAFILTLIFIYLFQMFLHSKSVVV